MASEKKTPEQARYQKLVKERMPKSRTLSQCIRAFVSGGMICCVGQLMRSWAQQGMGLDFPLGGGKAAVTCNSDGIPWGNAYGHRRV